MSRVETGASHLEALAFELAFGGGAVPVTTDKLTRVLAWVVGGAYSLPPNKYDLVHVQLVAVATDATRTYCYMLITVKLKAKACEAIKESASEKRITCDRAVGCVFVEQ